METVVNVTNMGGNELIIRTGQAPENIKPNKLFFTGSISSPGDYYESRQKSGAAYDPQKALISVSAENRTIQLEEDPTYPYSSTIVGRLDKNPIIEKMGINVDRRYSPQELAQVIRENRHHFVDKAASMQIITDLKSVKISVKGDIEQSNDGRGSRSNKFEQSVKANIPVSFTVSMPIFSGCPSIAFRVDIFFDVNNGVASCYLDSEDLYSIENDQAIFEISRNIERFAESGIPILYK